MSQPPVLTARMGTKGGTGRKKRTLTMPGLSSNRILSKLELAAVANDDWNLRAVFFVCFHIHDFRDDVFVSADHPTEHHMFALWEGSASNPDG